jgi:hypothetical protein
VSAITGHAVITKMRQDGTGLFATRAHLLIFLLGNNMPKQMITSPFYFHNRRQTLSTEQTVHAEFRNVKALIKVAIPALVA